MKYDYELNQICGKNIAVALYFYQKASENYQHIISILNSFFDFVQLDFEIYTFQDAKVRKIKNNVVCLIDDLVQKHDFNSSFCLHLSNDKLDAVHSVMVRITMSDLSTKPNILYFEFPPDFEFFEIFSFMKESFDKMDFFFACCNPVVSHNILYYPRSENMACKLLLENPFYTSQNSIYHNYSWLRYLNDCMIGNVNVIQVFSKHFYDKIELLSSIENDVYSHNGIYLETGENYAALCLLNLNGENDENCVETISALSEKELISRYRKASDVLSPMIQYNYAKNMFFKKSEWNKWILRFKE